MTYCIFYDGNGEIIGYGIDCVPTEGMKAVSREEYYAVTGDPRAAKDPEPEPEPEPDVWDELASAIREGVNEV